MLHAVMVTTLLMTTPPEACDAIRPLTGEHHHTGAPEEERRWRQRIDGVVDGMSFFARPLARKRLLRSNPIPAEVSIACADRAVIVSFDGRRYRAPLDGTEVPVMGVLGSTLRLSGQVREGALSLRFRGEDGGKQIELAQGHQGDMRMHTRIHSRKLPRDIDYTLTYTRRPSSKRL